MNVTDPVASGTSGPRGLLAAAGDDISEGSGGSWGGCSCLGILSLDLLLYYFLWYVFPCFIHSLTHCFVPSFFPAFLWCSLSKRPLYDASLGVRLCTSATLMSLGIFNTAQRLTFVLNPALRQTSDFSLVPVWWLFGCLPWEKGHGCHPAEQFPAASLPLLCARAPDSRAPLQPLLIEFGVYT